MSLTDDIKTLRARTQAGMMDCKNALKDANGNPVYCSEKLQKHVEGEDFNGTAFDIGTAELYKQLYSLLKQTAGDEIYLQGASTTGFEVRDGKLVKIYEKKALGTKYTDWTW